MIVKNILCAVEQYLMVILSATPLEVYRDTLGRREGCRLFIILYRVDFFLGMMKVPYPNIVVNLP